MNRPQTTVILAMTADGKIADINHGAARFASETDKAHLESQISLVDGVLLGASTLRAYRTSLPIFNPQLLEQRKRQHKPPQPIHIICSASGEIDLNLPFFNQSIPRWLLTTTIGAQSWQEMNNRGFARILITDLEQKSINWYQAFTQLAQLGLEKLAILGGGELVASLLEADLIDELWLTICPFIFGGKNAPTPVEGKGFSALEAKELELLSVERVDQEIFLHYRLK
jgi:5-amino-6-(5-phosphoribosylamino)uracil reductase